MTIGLLILALFFTLFIVYGVDSAHALEFKPLVAKNTDYVEVSTGIIGEPIVFESTITNDGKEDVNFEVAFSTRTIWDKLLDHQLQSVSLKPEETTVLTYQFVPTTEENYVSGIFYGEQSVAETVTFPALDKTRDYQKKTVRIYSDFSDADCLAACTDSSVTEIGVGTIIEFHNTTPDYRRVSTGSYVDEVNGISWSSDDRFHSMISPDRKSSFLFSQPGEYQLFLAEHVSSDVIGTIHVLSDAFIKSDSTIGILQRIMEDENSNIPITSLHVNPKNSVITVGIDDRKNPLFTLDLYKKMIYEQVGNVFLNVVADHVPKASPCDVNDRVKVRDAMDKDPVVRQFLKYHPNATFEHFKTPDEPGNPRTHSEFRDGLFLLRVLVLTYDQNGECYPVYSYSVSYDDPLAEPRKGLIANQYAKSDGMQEAIDAVRNLSNPIRQHEYGISNQDISCKDGLVVLVNDHRQIPSCVTKETGLRLSDRGWSEPPASSSCSGICESRKTADESKSEKVPVHDIRVEGLKNTYDVFELITFTIVMESYGIDHGGYEISINGVDEKNSKERWYEAKDVPTPDGEPASFTRVYEFPRSESSPIVFSKPGWYKVDFFVSELERAEWNFLVQYDDQLDFTNNVQEFQEKLHPDMRYDDLVWTFGEPDNDMGSGIHIYVYDMDDGSKILIGYSDYIWYAKHVDYRYNLIADLLGKQDD